MGNGSVNGSRVTTAGTADSIRPHHSIEDRETSRERPRLDQMAILESAFEDITNFFRVTFDKDQLSASSQLKEIDRDEYLIEMGDEVNGVHIIIEGNLMQERKSSLGKSIILRVLSVGDMIGEVETLMNTSDTTSLVMNTSIIGGNNRSKVLFVPKESVKDSLDGTVEKKLLREWCIKKAYLASGCFNKDSIAISIVIAAIKNSDLFSSWSHKAIEFLSRLCLLTLFQPKSSVYRKEEASNNAFVLVGGKIQCIDKNGSKQVIKVKHTDESYMFGEKDFLQKSSVLRQDTVNVIDPSLIVIISKELILNTIDKFTEEKLLFASKAREYRTSI